MAKKSEKAGIESAWELVENQRRVKDVAAARSIHNRFVQDSILRSQTRVQVRNQLEGGRPFDQSTLDSNGMGSTTNVNWGDAQADRDKTLLPYWKLVHDAPHLLSTTLESTSLQSDKASTAMAECFDLFIKDWGADYKIQFMAAAKNFVDFGLFVIMWPDYDSPRAKAVNDGRLYFPRNARMEPESWDVITMVRDVSASELWIKIKDKQSAKASKDAGWDEDQLKKVIHASMGGHSWRDPRDFTRWQDMLVQNDLTVASIFEPLQLCWMYVRNFDGKIACYVFSPTMGDDFLFQNEKYCDDWHDLLGCVWFDTGTDTLIHSIKGFAIKNFYQSRTVNMLKCRMIDGANNSFALNFQRNDDAPNDVPPIEQYGAVNILPPGITQVAVIPQIQGGMSVVEYLRSNSAENNALYRNQQGQQIQDTDTATQANLLAAQSGELMESSASLYLDQLAENVYAPMLKRLRRKGNTDKDAKKFVSRMRQRGIIDELIFDTDVDVKCAAHAGMASPLVRAQKFARMLTMFNLPGINTRWWTEQMIANDWGALAAQKGLLPEGQNSNPEQRGWARMENGQMGQGIEMPVGPNQAHFEHIQEHLQPLAQIAGQYQQTQQITPEAQTALIIGVQHIAQHMDYLSKDDTMKAQFQQVKPVFAEIQSVAMGLLRNMQKQQMDAQAQGGPPPMQGQQPAM